MQIIKVSIQKRRTSKKPKSLTQVVTKQMWNASLSRPSKEIYQPDFDRAKNWKVDTYRVQANRIKENKKIGEHFIYGKEAAALVHYGYVTRAELEPYRTELKGRFYDAFTKEAANEKIKLLEEAQAYGEKHFKELASTA